MYETILVATDGSDAANRAVTHALNLAERYESTLCAIHVVDTRLYGESSRDRVSIVVEELEGRGADVLEEFQERADNRGVTVETRLVSGLPFREIIGYADDVDADVVIVGYHGHTHAGRDHIGSVAERVLRNADRPVFVV